MHLVKTEQTISLGPGFCKPGPLATSAEKRCWIRAKYVHKAFVPGGHFEQHMLAVQPPSTQGPVFVGVLLITVVSANFPKRMRVRCHLKMGQQIVITKVHYLSVYRLYCTASPLS